MYTDDTDPSSHRQILAGHVDVQTDVQLGVPLDVHSGGSAPIRAQTRLDGADTRLPAWSPRPTTWAVPDRGQPAWADRPAWS